MEIFGLQAGEDVKHVDDLADACVFLMKSWSEDGWIDVGGGHDVSILQLAAMVMRVVGLAGAVLPDPARPDGAPRKLMDSSRLAAIGWRPRIGLEEGIARVYAGPPFTADQG